MLLHAPTAAVEELPDDKIMESYYFAEKAKAVGVGAAAKGRMKALVMQITSLRSDLPEGIYVRHGASRLDVLKVLIVGPKDTPYENGLFEFDMLCGKDFPQKPPDMQFRTTGGGRVAFNPNLYNSGKGACSISPFLVRSAGADISCSLSIALGHVDWAKLGAGSVYHPTNSCVDSGFVTSPFNPRSSHAMDPPAY